MSDSALRHAAAQQLAELSQALATASQHLNASKGAAADAELPADRLRADLLGLTTQLKQKITQLSLAVKPPVTGKAGWQAVQGTTAQVAEITMKCVFATGKLGNGLLAKELRWAIVDILDALQNLASTLAASLKLTASPSRTERERHLALTGTVWTAIDRFSETSSSDAQALSKALANELATMDDGLAETRDLLDATGSVGSDRNSDEDDAESLTDLERRRVESALRLLLSAKRLVKGIITHLRRSISAPPKSELARLQPLVSTLVASQDDLISTLPGPQDVDELRTFASAVLRHAQELSELATRLWPPDPARQLKLDSLIADLSLDDRASERSVSLDGCGEALAEAGRTLNDL